MQVYWSPCQMVGEPTVDWPDTPATWMPAPETAGEALGSASHSAVSNGNSESNVAGDEAPDTSDGPIGIATGAARAGIEYVEKWAEWLNKTTTAQAAHTTGRRTTDTSVHARLNTVSAGQSLQRKRELSVHFMMDRR